MRQVVSTAMALVSIMGSSPAAATGSQAAEGRGATAHSRLASRAATLLDTAFADAEARGSFRETLTQGYGSAHGMLEDDVALRSGRQLIVTSDGTRAQVLVVGNAAYIAGNQRALKSYFKFSSNDLAVIGNNWVSIPSTSTAYAAVAYDVTVPTALTEVAPTGHLTEGRATTIDGQRVIGISGGVPTVAVAGGKGTATLYVTASSHPLPVRVSMSASAAGRPKASVTGTLSDWGERVTVKAPTKPLQIGQLSTLEQQLAGLSIPGAPGYFTFTGSRGYPAPVGRPWGQACKPIRLAAAADVPSWVYAQMATVADAARKQGIDVVLETRRLSWRHGSLYYLSGQSPATSAVVAVTVDYGTPPKQPGGQPEHIGLGWDTKPDRDKHNEDLTEVQGTLWMKVLAGQSELVRRSIRQLIAWSQGISRTTDAISGISNTTTTDRFTKDDIAAMLTMSGCTKPTSGLGIAA